MLKRERYAWAWLTGLIVIPSVYFLAVHLKAPEMGNAILPRLGLLAMALVSLAIVALAARFLFTGRGDDEDAFIPDERDRRIEAHSTVVAYHVLMGGMIVVGFVMPFSTSGWELVHAAFLAIALAEVVRYAQVLLGYRRGLRD